MNIRSWILNNIPKNGIIVEAGACEGLDTDFFLNHVTEGTVYSFEPIPDLFEKTKQRVENYSNVVLFQQALSDTDGTKQMFVSDRFGDSWGSSSLLSPKEHLNIHTEITFKKEINVDSITLKRWYENTSVDIIDLIWLDLQGMEPVVLKSSVDVLHKTRYLYTEVSFVENYEGLVLYPEYKSFLEDNGFEVIFEDTLWEDGGNVLFGNKKI